MSIAMVTELSITGKMVTKLAIAMVTVIAITILPNTGSRRGPPCTFHD